MLKILAPKLVKLICFCHKYPRQCSRQYSQCQNEKHYDPLFLQSFMILNLVKHS